MNRRVLVPSTKFLSIGVVALSCATPEPLADEDSSSGGVDQGGASSVGRGGAMSGGRSPASGGSTPGSGGAPFATGGKAVGSGGAALGGAASGVGGRPPGTGGAGGKGTSTGPTSLPYSEDFEGTVGMPEWYLNVGEDGAASGDWGAVSDTAGNALQERSKTEESWAVGGNSAWTDQRLEVKVKIALTDPEAVADVRFRIAVRYGLAQAYFAEFQGNGSVQLGKDASSGGGDIGSEGTAPPFMGGTWTTVALEVKGSALAAYVGEMKVAEATDTAISMGGIALGSSEEAAILYDDLRVTAPP